MFLDFKPATILTILLWIVSHIQKRGKEGRNFV